MATLLDIVKKDATDVSVTVRIIDSGDGTPETGVVYNTSGIDLWYRREGATKTSITEADLTTPALDDAHADGGFLHISDGEYRLDLPDAAVATGAKHVDVGGTVTGMVVIGGRIRLVDYDPDDAVRLGLTALPNAAADAAGGLPISDAGGLDLDAVLSGHTPQTGDSFARLGAPAGASIAADIADVPTVAELTTEINDVQSDIAALNDLAASEVNAEVDTALADIHLDHLLAADYDPASKPGVSTALLNELIESNGGVSRYTAAALAQAPDTDHVGTGTGLTAIPWNAAWDAEVQSECADALAAYDPPTAAELVSEINDVQADIAALNDVAAADVLAAGDIDGYSLEEAHKIELTAAGGVLLGAGTNNEQLTAVDGSKVRIDATVTAPGNRTAVTLDATG